MQSGEDVLEQQIPPELYKEMYFVETSQLLDVFLNMEERNLFLMRTTQEMEQNVDEYRKHLEHLNGTRYVMMMTVVTAVLLQLIPCKCK